MTVFDGKTYLGKLRKNYHCWKRFLAETRNRGVMTTCVTLVAAGKGDEPITKTLTAFDLAEAEAQAWYYYFKQCGAIEE